MNRVLAIVVKPVIRLWLLAPHLPWPYRLVDHFGHIVSRVRGTTFESIRIGPCDAEIVRVPRSRPDRFIVYLHGGAFVVGGRFLHRSLISHIATASEATAVAIDYRKLPAHAIGHSITDAVAAYRFVLDLGIDPRNVSFAGDSAGGFLTFAAAVEARRLGLPLPAALVAISPLTNLDMTEKLAAPTAHTCPVIPPRSMHALLAVAERSHARASARGSIPEMRSPVDYDLRGLPPTLIHASSSELLYPDAVRMAKRLAAAGVRCELETWDEQAHVFQASMDFAPEAREAIASIGAFVRAMHASDEVRMDESERADVGAT